MAVCMADIGTPEMLGIHASSILGFTRPPDMIGISGQPAADSQRIDKDKKLLGFFILWGSR